MTGDGGSAARWGPLFGARAGDWADTWEGPLGWGTVPYQEVLRRTATGPGTSVMDCGCGAGRFLRMAADRGATVAGIDAAEPLIRIAGDRSPEADLRVGDLERLPWPDDSFDLVTGFSSFQFADDKVRALEEARRVSRGRVAIVIPTHVPDSGVTQVFKPLFPHFPPETLETMKRSGMFALSEPGRLDDVLGKAGLTVRDDVDQECPIVFADVDSAIRAFIGAGPMQPAIEESGEGRIAEGIRTALGPFMGDAGRITLPGSYRIVIAEG